jgi:hypothetical protein
VAPLTAVPVNLGDRHTLDTDIRDGLPDFIDLERLDHCGD